MAARVCVGAVANVNERIAPVLIGRDPAEQAQLDRLMLELDGTPNKSRLGANAIVGVSQAVALHGRCRRPGGHCRYLGGPGARRLPVPKMNVINGGKHADSAGFPGVHDRAARGVELSPRRCASARRPSGAESLLMERGLSTAVGDEGGFAPELESNEEACS